MPGALFRVGVIWRCIVGEGVLTVYTPGAYNS